MECLTAVVGSLAGTAVNPIARQVGYLFNYKSKREELQAQLEKLKDAREQVQRRIDEAKRNGDNILDRVETWLTGVNGKISAAEQLVEDETEAKKRCFSGLCPNLKSRYQFSKKAVKEAISIAELLEREGQFEIVSYRPAPEGIATRPAKDYEGFESRKGAFDGVMTALKDADVSIVGVYGMGGVGKTMLVKQVASQAKEENLFDYVVMAAVTQTPNILNIQNEIAEKLGMQLFDEKSCMDVRASRLCERLNKEKNVLIILDDIWEKMDLDALGVPSRDQHIGCKILVTSRRLDLLQSMGSQSNLPIEKLTEKEAWNLFKNMAGNVVERSDIQSTAAEVAEKCAGLPIAIATVAKALKHKEKLFIWKDALQKLKRPSKENFKGIAPDVYSAIELSYAFLEVEEVQLTFLLCSMMGHNAAIEDLLIYCRGFGLFRDLDTIQKVRDRILTLVSDLKNSSLLLSSSTAGCFDMHDVVRDVAVSIASSHHHWLALNTKEVSQYLSKEENEETMQNYNLISFQHGEVSGLPKELECPGLTFFSVGMGSNEYKTSSMKIPDNFFKGMQKLKFVYLANMEFSALPFSTDFHLLKTLRTLYLFRCELENINIIGELMNLEVLNLSQSRIKMLPREIGKLRKLKLLNLSDCYRLRVIPPNVLSGLSRLEELYLYYTFDNWEVVEGRESSVGSKASLVELENLSHLTTLEVHVRNVKAMPKVTTFFGKLERYKISIGSRYCYSRSENKLETSRMLKLSDVGDKMFGDGLLRKVEKLCLVDVKDVTNLERICLVESFSQLKVLRVSRCGRLNNLFSFSMVREFHQLEEIEVSDCENIMVLIAKKKEEETLKFDKLNSLKLSNLPKLVRLCGVEKSFSSSKQGKDQSIVRGSNVLGLFDHKVALPMLAVLEIKGMENLERLWPNQVADEESFPKLTKLHMERCHKLLNVFPLSMSRRLQRLEKLVIIDCKLVEEIFEEGFPSGVVKPQAEAENIITFEFSELTKLELVDLPNLKSFYHQIHTIKLPSLKKELKVSGCDKVGIWFGSSFPKNAQKSQQEIPINQLPFFCLNELNLEELSMGWKDSMKEIICQQIASQYFCRLKVVRLLSFPKEIEIFSSNLFKFLTSLPNLHHLEIQHTYFNEILEGLQEKKELFQNLRNLQVRWCPKLKNNNLLPSSISFRHLVALEIQSCGGIKKLVSYSTAKSLEQLQEMRISNCFEIEEIIEGIGNNDEDGDQVKDEIRFAQLKLLGLRDLPKLESFCASGNYTFQFPSLQTIFLVECPSMKMFSHGDSYTPMLHKVTKYESDKKGHWSGSINSTIQEMYKAKKFKEDEDNPLTLEQLTLKWNSKMKEIWHSNYGPLQILPFQYFCTFNVVIIQLFPQEMDIFPSQLYPFLISLPNLQRLRIQEAYFKEIFQSPLSEDQVQVVFPAIEELRFSIEKLRHDRVPQIASFGLLNTLEVRRCYKLKYLFPSCVVKSLVQLKTLVVSYCGEMEQLIILNEGLLDEERNNIIVFPQLDCLKLHQLSNLKRFCSENRIEFPSLRKLEIDNCPVLSTFNEVRKNNFSLENCHADVPQYLFNEGLSFSNLKELGLGWNDGMKEICNAYGLPQQLASQYFCNLKVIRLLSFPVEMEIFPSPLFQFLVSLSYLQGLEITNAYFKEIFQNPSSSALEKVQLKEALFQNLVTLVVHSCDEIKKLVTHSIAKSLVQLQEMKISFCDEIEEIIEGSGADDDEDGEVKDIEIHFPQLKLLELICLRKLESFCSSRSYTFQFPSLETVIVRRCPKMRIFSQGDSCTPILHRVKLSAKTRRDKERWSGNLNSTIQEMFKERKVWD